MVREHKARLRTPSPNITHGAPALHPLWLAYNQPHLACESYVRILRAKASNAQSISPNTAPHDTVSSALCTINQDIVLLS